MVIEYHLSPINKIKADNLNSKIFKTSETFQSCICLCITKQILKFLSTCLKCGHYWKYLIYAVLSCYHFILWLYPSDSKSAWSHTICCPLSTHTHTKSKQSNNNEKNASCLGDNITMTILLLQTHLNIIAFKLVSLTTL